ncbi:MULTISPECIES: histidine kinase famiy protein [Roseomonadaceae]|uniref:histidine kinase n=1 Tax=Falsiroseomonas oleicola TaxID=2801474 RepID=A0ABS6H8L1_9PROT|nr:histidine kinase famiy protein [Roseomonas oleicola]MBU8545029.1 PAS domain-containing protein [Roseomonas oleicola]
MPPDPPPIAPFHRVDRPNAPMGREDVFFAAIEMTRMPMVVSDPNQDDNPIVFANPAFQKLTGYTAEEVLGRNCRLLQGPDTDRATVSQIREAIATRTDIAVEVLNYRKDGTPFWNALFVSPVFGSDGSLLYFFGSQLDVTRRREAEEALRRTQRLEALGQLTGGVAHDFNNLLQVVVGSLEVMRPLVEQSGNPRVLRRHEGALEAARRGAILTRQLLAFARRQRLEGHPVDVNESLRDLSELLSRALGGLRLRLDLAQALPPARLDIGQLEAALVNLLLNAGAAMSGRGEVVISTRHRAMIEGSEVEPGPDGFVELAVTDTGTGIPAAILDRVTEPFFTTRDVGQGSGLGLAQVYGFVRQSGGHLRIDSEEGRGTSVRLFFPALPEDMALPAPAPRAGQDASAEPPGQGEQILVVDDNPEVLDLAAGLLADLGYQVATATDGPSALRLLSDAARHFDLLFSDVVMPGGLNGITLAREARQLRPSLRVLLSTGFVDPRDEAASGGIRPHGFPVMQKPYRRGEVARRIRRALEGNSAKEG